MADNGHGIQYEDLPILCERFTTSKLSSFDDLKTISTFGFRGEALASITHVANVSILSRTSSSPCAYKARYNDGKLIPIKPGDRAEPKPCAGIQGTTITVEDLFHNMPARRQAFKNYGEQYQKILDVVTRYSIHYANRNISFTCKKLGQMGTDLYTPNNSSVVENIRIAFGLNVAQELLDLTVSSAVSSSSSSTLESTSLGVSKQSPRYVNNSSIDVNKCEVVESIDHSRPSFVVNGKISNANYSSKKSVLILFVNNRLIENVSIKRAVDAVYADLLPKHCHPFVYISLELPPENLDVNVHPTKKEVHFLHEDEIVAAIYDAMSEKLRGANASRVFHVHSSFVTASSSSSSSSSHHSSGAVMSNASDNDATIVSSELAQSTDTDIRRQIEPLESNGNSGILCQLTFIRPYSHTTYSHTLTELI